jgi:hypothetical protein
MITLGAVVNAFDLTKRVVTTEVTSTSDGKYCGHIDTFDFEHGIVGWVLDVSAPETPIKVSFLIDSVVVSDHYTFGPRPDVAQVFGNPTIAPEFRVGISTISKYAALIEDTDDAEFSISIANSSYFLSRPADFPTLKQIISQISPGEKPTPYKFDIYEHLMYLRSLALSNAKRPLRMREDHSRGYIEAICADDQASSLFWFTGWTNLPSLTDEPVVVVDKQKFAAALSIVTYARDDLSGQARGLVGVMLSNWRPLAISKPVIFFGTDGSSFLRSADDLRWATKTDIAIQLEQTRKQHPIGKALDLLSLLRSAPSWPAGPTHGKNVHTAIDKILIYPEFGCFVTGWVISYIYPVTGFALKIGDARFAMDRSSLIWKARDDLREPFPDATRLLPRAGFCCFFAGQPDMRMLEEPRIKILLENGEFVVVTAPVTAVRVLGYSDKLDVLLDLYPAIRRQAFFEGLQERIVEDWRARAQNVTRYRTFHCSSAILLTLPDDQHDMRLAVEDVVANAERYLPSECGVAFICRASERNGDLLEQLEMIEAFFTGSMRDILRR